MKLRRKRATKKMEPNLPTELEKGIQTNKEEVGGVEQKTVKESNALLVVEIILLLMVGVLGGLWYWKSYMRTPTPKLTDTVLEDNAVVTTTPTPTPIPLHPGSETYTISSSDHTGPTITSVTLDPLDVQKGQVMTIVVDVSDSSDVTSVVGSLEMDSSKTDLVFTLDGGDKKNGSWKSEITLSDSVFYIYTLSFNAYSDNGTTNIKVTPR